MPTLPTARWTRPGASYPRFTRRRDQTLFHGAPTTAPVTIALRPRASADTARRAKDAMGYTPGGGEERGRLAFVLINRANEIADRYSTARSIVLGAAIARMSWAIC